MTDATGTGWNCGENNGLVTCSRESLDVGTAPLLTLSVTALLEVGVITNTALVSAESFDPDTGDNNASEQTVLLLPPLDTFTVGGNVSGLYGNGLVLQNNGGDALPIGADGGFTFTTPLVDGASYSVTVLTQPTNLNQTCSVTDGSSTLAGADITNVAVTCVTNTFTVGGNVSGLLGSDLVLQNNGGDALPIGADGSFTFTTPLADGSGYAVTVLVQPSGPLQICSVSNSSGTIAGADISNVTVTCVNEIIFVDGFEG